MSRGGKVPESGGNSRSPLPYGTKEPTVTVRRFFHISTWTNTSCTLAVTVTHPSFYRSTVSRPAVGQARRCHCSLVLPFYRIALIAPTPQTLNFAKTIGDFARESRVIFPIPTELKFWSSNPLLDPTITPLSPRSQRIMWRGTWVPFFCVG